MWNNRNEDSENLWLYPCLTPEAEKKSEESGYIMFATPEENLIEELKNLEKRVKEWRKSRDIIRKECKELWNLYWEEINIDKQFFLGEKRELREKSLEEATKKWGGNYKIQLRKHE